MLHEPASKALLPGSARAFPGVLCHIRLICWLSKHYSPRAPVLILGEQSAQAEAEPRFLTNWMAGRRVGEEEGKLDSLLKLEHHCSAFLNLLLRGQRGTGGSIN